MNHRPPLRRSTQISLQPVSRLDGPFDGSLQGPVLSISKPEPKPESRLESRFESKPERKRPFIEDFNMEHSCSNVTVALRAFSTTGDSLEQAKSRNPAILTMNAPSCVYLG
jgi:hypothetical protein